jgi:hypothetical protein
MTPTAPPRFKLLLDPTLYSNDPGFKEAMNFSGIVVDGDLLWLGIDEGTQIDRFKRDASGNYGSQRRFPLSPLLDLPGGKSEIDIEGLCLDSGYLWISGSHSLKRQKPSKNESVEHNIARLLTIGSDANRHVLGRVPLDAAREPVATFGALRSARLEGDANGDLLLNALRADKLIGPFCSIPSKENGLDVEGLAVSGDRVWAGLRGPVLRGLAVVVEFKVADSVPGRLKIVGGLVRHFFDLKGLGVRDLALLGKDLYILAGPTLDVAKPFHVFKWSNATGVAVDSFAPVDELPLKFDAGRPEALAVVDGAAPGSAQALVCYDGQDVVDMFGL